MLRDYGNDTDKYERAIALQPEVAPNTVKQAIAVPPESAPSVDQLPVPTQRIRLFHEDTRRDAKFVQFVHACLGSPPPTTFLHAIEKGFLSSDNQFPRLTSKMVRKHMPNSEATARGHLNKK
jgi:hypothetical protein